jgi:ferredoxin/flavodoxin---NADP+ reductase
VSVNDQYLVAVIGAGPAGLYAAQHLARQGVQVVLFNRDIKPGGLAEYGIFPDKHKVRNGLRAHFRRILEMPFVKYQGNITVGQSGDIKLDQLRRAGFQAFMVTTGAQQNNWLGLPGEDLDGVYHANSIVFHYNRLPEFSAQQVDVGQQVAVIGVGNVMLDIVHYIKRTHQACTVTAYARRGPTEVKFDMETLQPVAGCLDLEAIKTVLQESRPEVENVGKNLQDFLSLLTGAREKSADCDSGLQFKMRFLRTPRRLIGDETGEKGKTGRVRAIEFEINQLVSENGSVVPRGTGETEIIPADTVIFSIGSHVDPGFGLPVGRGNYLTTSKPRFPVDGISYEVYNPDLCTHCEDIFVSGWARLASEGIVGLARKDAERGAKALMQYLETLHPRSQDAIEQMLAQLPLVEKRVLDIDDLKILWEEERKIAIENGLPDFKFETNEAMLRAIERGS